jgi:hypothetical protein
MEIALWIIGIHLVELAIFLGYLLIQKNKKLENVIYEQNQYIEGSSFILSQLDNTLSRINEKMYVDGDPELEELFEKIKEYKNIINEFSKK